VLTVINNYPGIDETQRNVRDKTKQIFSKTGMSAISACGFLNKKHFFTPSTQFYYLTILLLFTITSYIFFFFFLLLPLL
jgi:hypothetical protein